MPQQCHCCAELEVETNPESLFHVCSRCHRAFCEAHVSHLDPHFCVSCMSDVVLADTTYTRTDTEWREKTNELLSTMHTCRKLEFSGADWVWHTRWLHEISDEELKNNIELHRAMVYQLENELTTRIIKNHAKLAKVSIPGQARLATTTISQVKTTARTVKTKAVPSAESVMEAILKLGLDPEQMKILFNKS